ncbi:prolyl oligopeptidase family serine peptidase [Streptomyces sp. SID3343]|uniref:S9 family peptidase n=1 Tax=Streptomyces sp. SID3343 TaxID=2690260 RepID=UPI00136D003B|nr:prolyl oligopeptidase family serine peptidase [Streptomyces sp. SID3343]MYV98226.1 prolyl oligopeptidase family serine peptidase [Streptomyces sp. SID3343]
MSSEITFPRQYARTQRFTQGAPRGFGIADGRITFLRSKAADHPATCLWALDPGARAERLVADPAALLDGAAESLSAEERARRERSREGAAGIVGYALDSAGDLAAFTLSGRLFAVSLAAGEAPREFVVPGPVIDPRPSPTGAHVAYVAGGALRVVAADGSADTALAEPDGDDVTWGLAEFIAAEEMSRFRGYWWAPDGTALIAARVDNAPVDRWWISDPANPAKAPTEVAYPAAGTANAEVTAWLLGLDGSRTELVWDHDAYPYLASVHWSAGGDPLLSVLPRDQKRMLTLAVDVTTGATRELHTETDDVWIDLFPGVPAWTPDGRLVRLVDADGARRLVVADKELTDRRLFVRSILDVGDEDVLITASAGTDAAAPEIGEIHVYRVGADGATRVSTEPGVHTAVRAGDTTVLLSSSLDRFGARVSIRRGDAEVGEITSYAATPVLTAKVELLLAGERAIPCALILPTGFDPASGVRLPVLMDPYGGPHGPRVLAARNPHLTSQWFADQGFAVIVADGRGTPGRSPEWEKSIHLDLGRVTLQDQVDALAALAAERPYLDTTRVGIRGWSYGGYLAALAVLRRPDVFHAAVAGAPVTDWALYDTHYTERYLGLPAEEVDAYRHTSLVRGGELGEVADTRRPLMLVHGLADDNVVAAHTLRLSSALLAAGYPHEVLPLSGVTHMTPQEQVAENLLLLQVAFLRRSLTG